MFKILKTENKARRGEFETVHGTIQTPVFMNVGTSAAVKGGISTMDLREVGCQVELSNTYHLHIRPGDDLIYRLGGLHKFFNWDRPILTDSGGFQVFSLAKLRKITEEGVSFSSHMDGKRIFMGPEESMQIQSHLASTIAMAFDECIENPAPYDYVKHSSERTVRWLYRCKAEMDRLCALPDTINKKQMLFGINQGGTYEDLRIANMKAIAELDLDGYAIGGLAVGEEANEMYRIIEAVEPYMPYDKPRYLMGVGTPLNILEAVHRGVDFFDCVMPSRNARHANLLQYVTPGTADAVMFNFGWLPGADHAVFSTAGSSIPALEAALTALRPGGVLSAILYSGRVIGSDEKRHILQWARALPLTKCTVLVCDFANWADTAPLPCLLLKK